MKGLWGFIKFGFTDHDSQWAMALLAPMVLIIAGVLAFHMWLLGCFIAGLFQ